MTIMIGAFGGALFALFINAFQNPVPWELQDKLSTREQLAYSYRDLVKQMKRMSRQLAVFGGVYGTVECIIERNRGCQDVYNHIYAGFVTGAFLARRGGIWGMVTGGAGFAAFSYVIELWMEPHHIEEDEILPHYIHTPSFYNNNNNNSFGNHTNVFQSFNDSQHSNVFSDTSSNNYDNENENEND